MVLAMIPTIVKNYMIYNPRRKVEKFDNRVKKAEVVVAQPPRQRTDDEGKMRKAKLLVANQIAERKKFLEETTDQACSADPRTWVQAELSSSEKTYTVTYWCETKTKQKRMMKELVEKHSHVFPGEDPNLLGVHNFNVNHLGATLNKKRNRWTLNFKDFDRSKSKKFSEDFGKANSINKTWVNMEKLDMKKLDFGTITKDDLWEQFPAVMVDAGTYKKEDDSILFAFRVSGTICTYRMPRSLALKEMAGIPMVFFTEMHDHPGKTITLTTGSLGDELNNLIYQPDLDQSNPKHPFPSPAGSWLCLVASICTAMHLRGLEDEAKQMYDLLEKKCPTKLGITNIINAVNPYLWENGIKYQLRNCKTFKEKYTSKSYAEDPSKWKDFPVIGTVRRANGDSVNHCVCFYNDWVFDDSAETALTLSNKANQSYICQSSELGTNMSKGWCIVEVDKP